MDYFEQCCTESGLLQMVEGSGEMSQSPIACINRGIIKEKEQTTLITESCEPIVTGVNIQVSRPYECDFQWCDCICHKRTFTRSSAQLNKVLGSLFVGYVALPFFAPPCNRQHCHRRERPSIQINYYFPPWFLTRVMIFIATYSDRGGPEMVIKIPRLCSPKADIFVFAATGNVDGIKTLFQRGLASPMDLECKNGLSPLHVRI
jgi:hypothetical protein